MSKSTCLWHVALGVGMGTQETRAHLSDEDLAAYGLHVRRALGTPAGDPIPDHPDYVLSARAIAGVLLGTVGRMSDKIGLCTFAVVSRHRQAAKAWQALHAGRPEYAVSTGDVPRVPYCAVRGEFGLALDPGAGAWLDAYQIAVAWAWIEQKAHTDA